MPTALWQSCGGEVFYQRREDIPREPDRVRTRIRTQPEHSHQVRADVRL